MGGFVSNYGTWRVNDILAVSRAIGKFDFKNSTAYYFYVNNLDLNYEIVLWYENNVEKNVFYNEMENGKLFSLFI